MRPSDAVPPGCVCGRPYAPRERINGRFQTFGIRLRVIIAQKPVCIGTYVKDITIEFQTGWDSVARIMFSSLRAVKQTHSPITTSLSSLPPRHPATLHFLSRTCTRSLSRYLVSSPLKTRSRGKLADYTYSTMSAQEFKQVSAITVGYSCDEEQSRNA